VSRDFSLLLLGALFYTVAAPPYEWSSAGWFALTPLFLVVRGKSLPAAFVAGLVYGVLFCWGIAHWVYFAIVAYFPFGPFLSVVIATLSYAVFIGSYCGVAAAGAALLFRQAAPWLRWPGVAALWVVAEFARSSLFSGFSWELLGYTQYRHLPLIQIADSTGVYGVSFLLAFSSDVAAEVISRLRASRRSTRGVRSLNIPWLAVGALASVLFLTLGYGAWRLRQREAAISTPLTIALVQRDIPNAQRWLRAYYAHVTLQYISTTQEHLTSVKPHLVVWPEFALGFYLDKEIALRAQLARLTSSLQAPLLVGAPRVEAAPAGARYYNSAYLLAANGALLDTYDKIRLLPFAEYRPLSFLPTLAPHSDAAPSEFTAGQRATIFSLPQGDRFGVTICYETTYPPLARRLAREGAQFFVNLSNETWLVGPGHAAAAQHFSMAVFRAVENRRTVARIATAGVSGFIDPLGRPYQVSTTTDGVSLGQVVPSDEQTLYTRYGDWFAFGCLGCAVLALLQAGARSPRRDHDG
jgi:apolipoprotein N-acyltransferase